MNIQIRYVDDIAIVEIEGRIDINSSKLIESVGAILEAGLRKVVIDLEAVDFVDYNGLSVLAITYKSILNQKGALILSGISLHILELLRIVKLDEVFEIASSVEEALGQFEERDKKGKTELLEQPLRRRFKRLEMDIPVTYRLSGRQCQSDTQQLYSGRLANICGAGLFIRTIHLLPPGSIVDVEINLGPHKEPRSIQGIVMWMADKGLQPDLYPGLGIKFTKISSNQQEQLITFIEKHIVRREE